MPSKTSRVSDSSTPTPPLTEVTDPLRAPSLKRRMACWLYEGMLLFGVVFIAGYLFSSLSQTRHALDNRPGLQAFLFLILGIYFTWFWHRGQTLAMKTWHIRVVSATGATLEPAPRLVALCAELGLVFTPPFAHTALWLVPCGRGLAHCGLGPGLGLAQPFS